MTWVRTLFGEVCSWSVHWDGCTVSDQSTIWRRSLIWAETDKIKRHYYKNAAKDPNEGFFTWTFQSSSPLGDEQITCQPFCHTNPLLHHMHEPVRLLFYSCCHFHLQHPLCSRSTFPPLHVQTSSTSTSPLMYSFIIVSFPVTVNKELACFHTWIMLLMRFCLDWKQILDLGFFLIM